MDVRLLAAVADDGLNVAEFCRDQGISRSTFYKWRVRYRTEGLAGLEERSRRPNTVNPRIAAQLEDRIVELRKLLSEEGLDAGSVSIRQYLVGEGIDPAPSVASIWRALHRRGFITPQPAKRPRSSYRRFTFETVNGCWQIDHYDWSLADGTSIQIIDVIDDHSRMAHARAVPVVTGPNVWDTFLEIAQQWGLPSTVLTDNGLVYNGHRRNVTVGFETNLRLLGINPISSSPYHPQTCGKVERLHQTEQKWLRARPPASTLNELNQLLDDFTAIYNYHRPHRSLQGATPATIHHQHPKTGPADRPLTGAKRITTARVTVDGTVWSRPWRIAVGHAHAGREVTIIIDQDQGYVFADDQLLRHLTLNPTRQHQPLGCPR
jgi:transposase InsO family protein